MPGDLLVLAVALTAGIAPLVAALVAYQTWRRRGNTGARPFSAVMAVNTAWVGAYAASMFLPADVGVLAFRVSQAALTFVAPAWLVFAVTFAGYEGRLTRGRVAALLAFPVAGATAILLAPTQLLVWSAPRTVQVGWMSAVAVDLGVVYWASTAYAYATITLGFAVLAHLLARSVHVYRRQVLVLMLAGVPPTVGNVLYLTGNSPVPPIDPSPFAFVLEGVIVYWALFHYQLLDLTPIGRTAVLDDLEDGVIVVDDDHRIVDHNRAAGRLFDERSAVGTPVASTFPELDRVLDGTEGGGFAADGGDSSGEIAVEDGDGTLYFDARTTPLRDHRDETIGHAVVLRDVTERKERETIFRELQGTARDLMACESPKDVATRTVQAIERILSLPYVAIWLYDEDADALEPAAASDPVADLYDDVPTFAPGEGLVGGAYEREGPQVIRDVHEHGGLSLADPDAPIRGTLLFPLGEHGVVGIAGVDPLESDDEVVHFTTLLVATVRSALARTARERELARKNDRLETFASVVSHDLRSPLAVAQGHLDLVRREVDDEESVVAVGESLDRMEQLTDDLLTLARQGETDAAPEPFGDVIRGAWTTVETGDLELDPPPQGYVVHADRGRLRELLENLFRNCVDHATGVDGGATTLTVGIVDEDGSPAGFFVADDGPGIPEDRRDDVLDHGYTTDETGTGLGLAIVERIAEAHGWTVAVDASEDGGARFDVGNVRIER